MKILFIIGSIFWFIIFLIFNNFMSFFFLLISVIGWHFSSIKRVPKEETTKSTTTPTTPVPTQARFVNYEKRYSIYGQDQKIVDKFFYYYKDELDVDDEYGMSASNLKEYLNYDEKLFKYQPYLDCQFKIEDKIVYVKIMDEFYKLGELNQKDIDEMERAIRKRLVYFHGDYKYYDYYEDKIIKSKMDSYFKLVAVYTKIA